MGLISHALSHSSSCDRKIIHIDMDCFFAAIEERENPTLKGRPVAVGGDPKGRGVLCTANYVARRYGVRSAMSSAQALKLCPQLLFIKPRSDLYRKVGLTIRQIFRQYSAHIEPLSLDEAFLDVTETLKKDSMKAYKGSATLLAMAIKQDIFHQTKLTASAGVAPNKFLAKVASDWQKPNGLTVISPHMAKSFASQLPVEKVPGIGKVSAKKFHELGLHTLHDISQKPLSWLVAHLGKNAHSLYLKSQGIDERPVSSHHYRKGISCERTYSQDLLLFSQLEEQIPLLREELFNRLMCFKEKRPHYPAPYKIFIKAKNYLFENKTHETLLDSYHAQIMWNELFITKSNFLNHGEKILPIKKISSMYQLLYDRLDRTPIRLLGIGFRFPGGHYQEKEHLGQLRLL